MLGCTFADMLIGISSADNNLCLSNQTLEAEPVLESEELLGSPFSSVPICCQNAQCQCVTSRALSNKAEHKDGKLGSMSTPTTCNKPTTYSSAVGMSDGYDDFLPLSSLFFLTYKLHLLVRGYC